MDDINRQKQNEKIDHTDINVYVVDDDAAVRDSMEMLLISVGFSPRCFESANHFLEEVDPSSSGCLLLDIRMPGMDGLELQEKMAEMGYTLPTIFITGHGDVPMAVKAMKGGAIEFLQKPFKESDLLNCIERTATLVQEQQASDEQKRAYQEAYDTLTPRERSVMEKVIAGDANKVIAIDLGISQRTVEIHRSRVMKKMGFRSVAELVQASVKLQEQQPET